MAPAVVKPWGLGGLLEVGVWEGLFGERGRAIWHLRWVRVESVKDWPASWPWMGGMKLEKVGFIILRFK